MNKNKEWNQEEVENVSQLIQDRLIRRDTHARRN